MQCPKCDKDLLMSERHGIEIDYCPQCRGVWLDRGELDKIIRRARDGYDDDDEQPDRPRRPPEGLYYKKRESFWSNLFDFD
jgi:uncharacterized protein